MLTPAINTDLSIETDVIIIVVHVYGFVGTIGIKKKKKETIK